MKCSLDQVPPIRCLQSFGATEGLTVDCKVTCGSVVFVFFGVLRFGRIGEILCCVVVTVV